MTTLLFDAPLGNSGARSAAVVLGARPEAGSKVQLAQFQRRLPGRAFETTRELACRSGWMRDLLAEWAPGGTSGRLRLAVRNGYVNFYHRGQSVSKVDFRKRRAGPTSCIHHKYIVPDARGQTYIKILPFEGLDDTGNRCEWGGPEVLRSWVARAACFANREKEHIDKLLNVSSKVIDLEIALPALPYGRRNAPRMDIATLENCPDGAAARIVFWEVKMIDDARLRSTRTPKVVKQIEAYEEYVGRNPGFFEDAYRETCRILGNFHDIASRLWKSPRPLDPLISAAAEGNLMPEPQPRLLIIDDGSSPGRDWERHLRKLTSRLADRVHMVSAGELVPIETAGRV